MNYKTPLALLLVLTFLIGADYLSAWVAPAAVPPSSNVAAPVNTSGTTQTKPGLLGVSELIAGDAIMVNRADVPTVDTKISLTGNIAASAYCDENGQNCFTAKSIIDTFSGAASPSTDIVYGVHTQAQCTAAGGTIFNTGSVSVCRFNGVSCPSGWTKYQQWTTTASQTCGNACGTRCTAAGHAFTNLNPATCTYVPGRDTARGCDFGGSATCTATITQVGCY